MTMYNQADKKGVTPQEPEGAAPAIMTRQTIPDIQKTPTLPPSNLPKIGREFH